MTAILVVLAVTTWLAGGTLVGLKSLECWRKKDNRSRTAALLFPMSRSSGTVGETSVPPMMLLLDGRLGSAEDRALYVGLLAIGWPVKLIWNGCSLLLLSPKALLDARRQRQGLPADDETGQLADPVVRSRQLLEERSRIDRQLIELSLDMELERTRLEDGQADASRAVGLDDPVETRFRQLEQAQAVPDGEDEDPA